MEAIGLHTIINVCPHYLKRYICLGIVVYDLCYHHYILVAVLALMESVSPVSLFRRLLLIRVAPLINKIQ